MFSTIKRYIKQLRTNRQWEKRRHQSSYRATALAVQLVITGALTPCRSTGASIIPLRRS